MSSSNECGTITNRTSMRWARVIICPKVIDTCRSSMRRHTAAPVPSSRTSSFPLRAFSARGHTCALTHSGVACHSASALLSLSFWPFVGHRRSGAADRAIQRLRAGKHRRHDHQTGRRLLRLRQRRVAEGSRHPAPAGTAGPSATRSMSSPAGRSRRSSMMQARRAPARSPARWPTSAPPS